VQVHIDRIENNNQIERELTHSQFFDRVSMSMLLLKLCLLPPLHIWAWISRIVNSLGNSKKTDCYPTKQISLDTRSTFSKSYYNSTRTHKDMCIRNKKKKVRYCFIAVGNCSSRIRYCASRTRYPVLLIYSDLSLGELRMNSKMDVTGLKFKVLTSRYPRASHGLASRNYSTSYDYTWNIAQTEGTVG